MSSTSPVLPQVSVDAPPRRRGRPPGSKNKPKIRPIQNVDVINVDIVSKPAPPTRVRLDRDASLDDGMELRELPASGMCTCGNRPYPWNEKRSPNIGYYCSHNTHGGNGKFWLWAGTSTGAPMKKTRKTKDA